MFGNPRPRYAIYAPVFTPAGPAAFGRDRESSRQVWSAEEGYPGDPAYRDFYRDIGFDLSAEYLRRRSARGWHAQIHRPEISPHHRPHAGEGTLQSRLGDGARRMRTPGTSWARAPRRSSICAGNMNVPPIVVSPFDAELFGHWWFEGPEFLNLFIRKAVYDQDAFQLTTPSRYLAEHDTHQMLVPSASSWGHKGYWEVWLDDSNSWIYPAPPHGRETHDRTGARLLGEGRTARRSSSARCARWPASSSSRSRATGPS